MSISKAIDGFQKFKVAEGLSQRRVDSYEYYLNQWLNYTGDRSLSVRPQPQQLALQAAREREKTIAFKKAIRSSLWD